MIMLAYIRLILGNAIVFQCKYTNFAKNERISK